VDWIHLARERDKWRAPVRAVKKVCFHKIRVNFGLVESFSPQDWLFADSGGRFLAGIMDSDSGGGGGQGGQAFVDVVCWQVEVDPMSRGVLRSVCMSLSVSRCKTKSSTPVVNTKKKSG
jgi:hypothetical protein